VTPRAIEDVDSFAKHDSLVASVHGYCMARSFQERDAAKLRSVSDVTNCGLSEWRWLLPRNLSGVDDSCASRDFWFRSR